MCGNGTTIRDRREEATGTQYIHPITRFPSIIVIGGQSIILTTLSTCHRTLFASPAQRVTTRPVVRRLSFCSLCTACPSLPYDVGYDTAQLGSRWFTAPGSHVV